MYTCNYHNLPFPSSLSVTCMSCREASRRFLLRQHATFILAPLLQRQPWGLACEEHRRRHTPTSSHFLHQLLHCPAEMRVCLHDPGVELPGSLVIFPDLFFFFPPNWMATPEILVRIPSALLAPSTPSPLDLQRSESSGVAGCLDLAALVSLGVKRQLSRLRTRLPLPSLVSLWVFTTKVKKSGLAQREISLS